MNHLEAFRSALTAAGIGTSIPLSDDGKIHRYASNGDSDACCWYILYPPTPVAAGAYGCWKRQINEKWHLKPEQPPDPKTLSQLQAKWREAEVKRARDEADRHSRIADSITEKFRALKPAPPDHLYLKIKSVAAHGNLRVSDDNDLIIPLTDGQRLWSWQSIDPLGDKLFYPGGRVQGCYFPLFEKPDGPLVICEGYATGATLHEATGWSVWCAMNCGNLLSVAQLARQNHPERVLILAADNDRFTTKSGEPFNPGVEKARIAAKSAKAWLSIPDFADTDTTSTDYNDLALTSGLSEVARQVESAWPSPFTILTFDEISTIPIDINDCILGDHLLDKGQQLVIAGQGGSGKTRLYFQLIAACIAGHPRFLNIDLHSGAKHLHWLVLQTENSVRRLKQTREILKNWIGNEAWANFNRQVRVQVVRTDQDAFVNLDSEQNITRLRAVLERYPSDAVVFDALYDFGVGDLNKDVDMRATCTALSRLIRWKNPKRLGVIPHHSLTGQAGAAKATGLDRSSFARNSKVLYNWTRAQVNLAPMTEDSNDQLSVSCAKCSDGKEFKPFAIKLNPETLIYECDSSVNVNEWSQEIKHGTKGNPAINSFRVRELCDLAGSTKSLLAKAIMDDCGCSKASAYRFMSRAESDKEINFSNREQKYFRA